MATFGTIFSNALLANLAHSLPAGARASGASLASVHINPMQLQHLPAALHVGYVHAYASALQPVFFVAGCIGIAAFLLAWLIPEVALKETTRATDSGDTYAMPSDRTSAQELERGLAVLANREDRARVYQRLADAAGIDLDPLSIWLLIRLGQAQPTTVQKLAWRLDAQVARLQPALDRLAGKACINQEDGNVALTRDGSAIYSRLVDLRVQRLEHLLHGWPAEQRAEMVDTLRSLAERLLSDDFGNFLAASRSQLRAVAEKT